MREQLHCPIFGASLQAIAVFIGVRMFTFGFTLTSSFCLLSLAYRGRLSPVQDVRRMKMKTADLQEIAPTDCNRHRIITAHCTGKVAHETTPLGNSLLFEECWDWEIMMQRSLHYIFLSHIIYLALSNETYNSHYECWTCKFFTFRPTNNLSFSCWWCSLRSVKKLLRDKGNVNLFSSLNFNALTVLPLGVTRFHLMSFSTSSSFPLYDVTSTWRPDRFSGVHKDVKLSIHLSVTVLKASASRAGWL